MTVKLVWATPNADDVIMYCARVSNPAGQDSGDARLLKYCHDHGHHSVFEMASMCVEINAPRDVTRQILRHRSASFQEFSGRYSDMRALGDGVMRPARLQDKKNRQSSLEVDQRSVLATDWLEAQQRIYDSAMAVYDAALRDGIAKEVARAVLPEGLVNSRLYMSATIRTFVHYLRARLDPSTQKEHREVAAGILEVLRTVAPITAEAFFHE